MRPARAILSLFALVPALAGAAANAQRLDYADMISNQELAAAEHAVGPRLNIPAFDAPLPAPIPEADDGPVRAFYGDRLEWRSQRGVDGYNWDWSGEIGGPRNRLWLATTGDGLTGGGLDYVEVQALYSRPVTASGLAVQAGVRRDFVPRPRRSYAVLGLQGNVSDPLYVGAFGFLSHRGEFTGRVFAYYDLPLVGDLVLQPAVESEVAGADVPELGIGAGPIYAEAGLRLRFRFAEPFAPYIGVNWERLLGRTARLARQAGDDVETASFVLGLRSYF